MIIGNGSGYKDGGGASVFLISVFTFLFYVCERFACVWCTYVCDRCPWVPEKGIRFPGTGIMYDCEPPCGYWELNPGKAASLFQQQHRAISPAQYLEVRRLPPTESIAHKFPELVCGSRRFLLLPFPRFLFHGHHVVASCGRR